MLESSVKYVYQIRMDEGLLERKKGMGRAYRDLFFTRITIDKKSLFRSWKAMLDNTR